MISRFIPEKINGKRTSRYIDLQTNLPVSRYFKEKQTLTGRFRQTPKESVEQRFIPVKGRKGRYIDGLTGQEVSRHFREKSLGLIQGRKRLKRVQWANEITAEQEHELYTRAFQSLQLQQRVTRNGKPITKLQGDLAVRVYITFIRMNNPTTEKDFQKLSKELGIPIKTVAEWRALVLQALTDLGYNSPDWDKYK